MDDDEFERRIVQLKQCLPETLRKDWLVVPQSAITQYCIVSGLLGVALTALAIGIWLEVNSLRWIGGVVLVGLPLAKRWWPWWRQDRSAAQLRALDESGPS